MRCAVCEADAAQPYRTVDGVAYFRCAICGSLFAHPASARIEPASPYTDEYWRSELERGARTLLRPRDPARGGDHRLLPPADARLHRHRRRHRLAARCAGDAAAGGDRPVPRRGTVSTAAAAPHRSMRNYVIGTLADMRRTFDAGVCIEVIEHLTPATLRTWSRSLPRCRAPGSLYLFNSGQPAFVEREDPGYLDPHGRGHVVSYSLAGAAASSRRPGSTSSRCPAVPGRSLPSSGPRAAECRCADHTALASGAGECSHAAVGTVRRADPRRRLDTARAALPQHGRRRRLCRGRVISSGGCVRRWNGEAAYDG